MHSLGPRLRMSALRRGAGEGHREAVGTSEIHFAQLKTKPTPSVPSHGVTDCKQTSLPPDGNFREARNIFSRLPHGTYSE